MTLFSCSYSRISHCATDELHWDTCFICHWYGWCTEMDQPNDEVRTASRQWKLVREEGEQVVIWQQSREIRINGVFMLLKDKHIKNLVSLASRDVTGNVSHHFTYTYIYLHTAIFVLSLLPLCDTVQRRWYQAFLTLANFIRGNNKGNVWMEYTNNDYGKRQTDRQTDG